jgi:3'(2'), 5'-bisphosphate nucleotidase
MSSQTYAYIEELKKQHGEIEFISSGSSIKICLVADGSADCYPRFGPTMEWDTASGQAIAEFAGKQFVDVLTQQPMTYNKKNLLNNSFIVS